MRIRSAGFTLLETLIALAIMSVASLALFQSTASMLRVSERALEAGEEIIDDAILRQNLFNLIDRLVPAWRGQSGNAFLGNARQFSGLTSGGPGLQLHHIVPFSVALETRAVTDRAGQSLPGQNQKGPSLIYRSGQLNWPLQTYDYDGEQMRFDYLAPDNKWYGDWPPKALTSLRDDQLDIATITLIDQLKLPLAVRLVTASGDIVWLVEVTYSRKLPPRSEI